MVLDSTNSMEQLLGLPDGYLLYAELLVISSAVWWIVSSLWEFPSQVNVSYSAGEGDTYDVKVSDAWKKVKLATALV